MKDNKRFKGSLCSSQMRKRNLRSRYEVISEDAALLELQNFSERPSVRDLAVQWNWSKSRVQRFISRNQFVCKKSIQMESISELGTLLGQLSVWYSVYLCYFRLSLWDKNALLFKYIIVYLEYKISILNKQEKNDEVIHIQELKDMNLFGEKEDAPVEGPGYSPDFLTFFDLSLRKEDKARAFKNWKKACKKSSKMIIHKAWEAYNAMHKVNGTERQYIKKAANWLSDESYFDYAETKTISIEEKGEQTPSTLRVNRNVL